MGVCADPGSYRWCQALSRSRSSFATINKTNINTSHKQNNNEEEEQQQQPQNIINHKHKQSTTIQQTQKTKTTTSLKSINNNNNNYNIKNSYSNKNINLINQQKSTKIGADVDAAAVAAIANVATAAAVATVAATVGKRKIISHQNNNNYNICQLLKSFQLVFLVLVILAKTTYANIPEDAVHITAILGEGVIFNCHVEFPNDHPVPYVLQWDKKVSETGSDLPIYIWYESYPEHIEEGYKGRVSRVSQDSPFGSASLNLTNIKESDQGWYECKVVFLNRDPKQHKNGTWFHLDVHAPPRFSVTPEDIIYVNLGDSIILNCQADGTPTPEILWYKDASPVDPSPTVGIFNDGTELRISTIRHEDIGEYTCIARNGEGQVSHTARVIIAGGAVIMPGSGNSKNSKPPPTANTRNSITKTTDNAKIGITVPPTNQTKLEGEKVIFSCEAKAMPGNVTVRWFREGSPVREVASLETRVTIRKDGSLIINPVSADDSGQYLCEVTNGIGDPQSASAYLNIEYPAKVTFTPTVQYLPFRLAGVVQCYIKSNPQLQYVTWTKDKRLLEPYQMKDIVVMSNGSLLFTRVNEDHQGRYTCTPYNAQGTQGSSGPMEVLVRKPPTFTVEPESLYQRKVSDSVEMHCDAMEAEGTQRPTIKWQRQDGEHLSESQRNRVKISGGNITIENLRREDFGYYQCVVSNEVATLMSVTQLVIEGTQPHAPYNITGKATESSITLQWMPGYSGGSEYKQDYTIWYREAGISEWQTISVTPSGSTQVTINGLASGTTYEFQVVGRNVLGDGMMSKVMTVRTLEDAPAAPRNVKAATQPPDHIFQLMPDEAGPKPGPPRNLTVTEVSNGFLISWQSPLERAHIVKFYTIKYRTDAQWKTLNRGQIRPEETQYLVKNLVGGRTYYFRVLANSEKSYESSDEVKFPVPARVKHKAITAGVVGGILFFIVAIILSVCAVKICNKRKRRKQEKEFNMVACRITDTRNIATTNNHHQHHHQQQQQQQQQQHQHQQQQQRIHSHSTGSISGGQVPLKKYKQTRISSLTTILIAILHWIWPPDRCTNCHSIYSSPHLNDEDDEARRNRSVSQIQRSVDGRFVLTEVAAAAAAAAVGGAEVDKLTAKLNALTNGETAAGIDEVDDIAAHMQHRRNSNSSQNSSSDDGGFLSRRNFITARASWRRPLVASPSQLSLQSAVGSARGFLHGLGGLLRVGSGGGGGGGVAIGGEDMLSSSGARYQNVYRNHYGYNIYRNLQPAQPAHPSTSTSRPLHINTVSGGVGGAGMALGGGGGGSLHPHHITHHMHHDGDLVTPNLYTPSRVSRIFSSSPASTPNDGMGIGGMSNTHVGVGAGGGSLFNSPWAMTTPNHHNHHYHFSDLSTVYPSSAERSFPTPSTGNLSRYRYYSHDLPSLRTIQEETRRYNQQQEQQQQQHHHHQQHLHGFVPLQIPSPPSWRSYYHTQMMPYHSYRPRTRWYPRHYSRLFGRSQSELMSPLPHLNLSLRSASAAGGGMGLEASPESRSSSSGFGSKNTSNQPHGSHHSGSTSEWRLLPPYRPPPPPPATTAYFGSQHPMGSATQSHAPQQAQAQAPSQHQHFSSSTLPYYSQHHQHQHHHATSAGLPSYYSSNLQQRPITPPYTMEHWLDMISRLNAATDNVNLPKSVDVGSVDGHYEFDPSTPTPSASTPTGGLLREDLNLHIDTTGHHTMGPMSGSIFHTTASGLMLPSSGSATFGGVGGGRSKARMSRYDNIDVRLQAMKEEFYAYRKRQAMKRAGVAELESVC